MYVFFFFQAEDGIRDGHVTGVQTCALPISVRWRIHSSLVSTIDSKNAFGTTRSGSAEPTPAIEAWRGPLTRRSPLRVRSRRPPGPPSRVAPRDRVALPSDRAWERGYRRSTPHAPPGPRAGSPPPTRVRDGTGPGEGHAASRWLATQ